VSLKAVELQVALPRTHEVARIQEQMQHRTMHEQQALIQDRKQSDELSRKQTTHVSDPGKALIKPREDEKQRSGNQKKDGKKKSEQETSQSSNEPLDPYRGKHIDLSL
jgi:hypothetical protein